MPEGHSVHRIARQFGLHFVGKTIAASSPQGRFGAGAADLDGHVMTASRAVGKNLFLEFDHGKWLRVHLGMYGAWDFAGDITADATTASSNGRMGQTNQRGTILDSAGEDSLASIGAPRRTRLRMAEQETLAKPIDTFPPEPIGAVRVRLLTDAAVADLRGPTACDVLRPEEVAEVVSKLGPDPLVVPGKKGEEAFVRVVAKKPTPIGLLLMDQTVISGIGNVYRAELLFRARQNPHTPGRDVPEESARALWKDWSKLLKIGVATGQMLTMDRLGKKAYLAALANREDRHWVYRRAGLPCRVCGTAILTEVVATRNLYWCPFCQA